MRKFWKEFFLRGALCSAGGPVILAMIYGVLGATGAVEHFSPSEVCLGILSITLMAFVVAGMTAIYQMEQLPLPMAILLHGSALYVTYILTYLVNGWLQQSLIPILVFTGIFVVGYAVIWAIIFAVTKAKAEKINRSLKRQN